MLSSAAQAEVVFGGVAAGDMSTTEAVLWVRADNSGGATNLIADVATDADFANIVATLDGVTSRDSDFTLKLRAGTLTPHTRYFYRFRASDGVTSPIGQFSTAPAASQRAGVKFGFSGDADGRFRPYPSIANLAAQKLDFFVFLGDAMYETASTGSPAVPLITGETADPTRLEEGLKAYTGNIWRTCAVDPATGQPSASGQQSLQPMLAATGSYTLLDNHELGNRSLQSGGAPPSAPPETTDPRSTLTQPAATTTRRQRFARWQRRFSTSIPRAARYQAIPLGCALSGPRASAYLPICAATAHRSSFRAAMGCELHLHPDRRPQLSRHPSGKARQPRSNRRCRTARRQPKPDDAGHDPIAMADEHAPASPAGRDCVEIRRDLVADRRGRQGIREWKAAEWPA
jgi:hypothetical protein